jgi:hypothetical protein
MTRILYWKRFLNGFSISLRIMLSYKKASAMAIFLSPDSKSRYLDRLPTKNDISAETEGERDERADDKSGIAPELTGRLSSARIYS